MDVPNLHIGDGGVRDSVGVCGRETLRLTCMVEKVQWAVLRRWYEQDEVDDGVIGCA